MPNSCRPSADQVNVSHGCSCSSVADLPSGETSDRPFGPLYAIHLSSGDHCTGEYMNASRARISVVLVPTRVLAIDHSPRVPCTYAIHVPSGDQDGESCPDEPGA